MEADTDEPGHQVLEIVADMLDGESGDNEESFDEEVADDSSVNASEAFDALHCKNCGVLCPPNEQHTIGVISHRPLKVCLAHLIWCARS